MLFTIKKIGKNTLNLFFNYLSLILYKSIVALSIKVIVLAIIIGKDDSRIP